MNTGSAMSEGAVQRPPSSDGYFTYQRAFKERFETSISSATQNYSFTVPDSWKEDITSLNDGKLYGVDLRMSSKSDGQLAVSVLPYANRTSIAQAGDVEKAISTFVELVGAFWDDNGFGDPYKLNSIGEASVERRESDGLISYYYEIESPFSLLAATCTDGQLYLLNVSATKRQKAKAEENLRKIRDSFYVPKVESDDDFPGM